ncbi:AAA family ATPase [Metabacillus sp. 22489]|uniref:AAA family ATPase n=1 Tax=Metabacillus sp. 22489 TaxID=3453928 RepID=UPI003F842A6A
MRPIQLTVSGLHSFREKQTIQFDSLCEGGIFGIFGPTGSGKSSILDAMTLALYGKVERAANNTHGILNHAEDSLAVSFTFELENASSKKRYTVERGFKRTDDIKVKTSICRLIEAGEETVVLADKAADVNEKIHGLLGLTIDDFTRAVVLPQGKFAEFLSLKGAERRQMLQRLFHLEQYGDKLIKKLKSRLAKTRIQRNELEAEKTGLGDASTEAVQAAEARLNEANILLEKRQTEYDSILKEYEAMQEIRQLQLQKAEIEKEKVSLEAEADKMDKLKLQLQKAEEAEALRPYAESLQALMLEKRDAEVNLSLIRKQYEEVKEQYETSNLAYEEIRNIKSEREPQLVAEREKLLQLQKIDEERVAEQKRLAQLQEKFDKLVEQRHLDNKALEKAQTLVERALEKQQRLKEELLANTVSAKEREMIQGALTAKQTVTQAKHRFSETTTIVQEKQKIIEQETENLKRISVATVNRKNQLKEQFIELNKQYFLISEREREHHAFIHTVKSELDFIVKKEEKENSQKLALKLVQHLHDGEPCPVCGSSTHPNPAHLNEELYESGEKQSEKLQEQLERLQDLSQEFHSLKIKLEGISQQLTSEFPFLQDVTQVEEIELDEIIKKELADPLQKGDKLFQLELKTISQDYLQLKSKIDLLVKQVREIQQEELRKGDYLSSAKNDVSEWKEKQQVDQVAYEKALKEYEEQFSTVPLTDVETLQQDMSKKDQAVEQLNERIQTSILFIEEQQTSVKECEKQIQLINQQEIELQATINNCKQLIREKEEKLSDVSSDKSLNQQLKETIEKLKQLTEKENELYRLLQQATKSMHEHQSQLAANEKAFEQTKLKLHEATEKWKNVSEKTSFHTIEETLSSLLGLEEKHYMKNELEKFTDKMKQLTSDLNRIAEKLQDKQLTNEAWEQIQLLKKEVKEQVDEAVANKGAASEALQELLKKHDRYVEIERQQKALDEMLEKLEKLQTVFKGNSFVEYVAEEQLVQVSRDASERLRTLTRGRYAIEVDSQGGFIMRDDANGGVRRPVSTLSGGETFLTSLALALSLSTQIQLRGEYPLQFFFLDEGFGTLDVELLDTVISALEKLQAQNLSVGVISHVAELRARLPKKLIVVPAEPSGKGSTVYLESM